MKLVLIIAAAWLALPVAARAQDWESGMIRTGIRVRLTVTDTVLRSPEAKPDRPRRVIGTVRAITRDTIRLEVAANEPTVAIPRILIYSVERSLGRGRDGSVPDAALMGGGVALFVALFVNKKAQVAVLGGGFAIGALVGAVRPFERWETALIPE